MKWSFFSYSLFGEGIFHDLVSVYVSFSFFFYAVYLVGSFFAGFIAWLFVLFWVMVNDFFDYALKASPNKVR